MSLFDLSPGGGIDRGLQVKFLRDTLRGQPCENFVSFS